jgi:hypothetical protein
MMLSSLPNNIVEQVLFAELIVLCIAGSVAYFMRVIFGVNREKRTIDRALLNDILVEHIQEDKELDVSEIPRKLTRVNILVPVVENMDAIMSGDDWCLMKKNLVKKFVLADARKNAKRGAWMLKSWSIRVMSIYHELEDEKLILDLVADKSPLVSFNAAVAAVSLSTKDSVDTVIDIASSKSRFSRYAYRDALIGGDVHVWEWVSERLKNSNDPSIRLVCLEVLSVRQHNDLYDIVLQDLDSESLELRLASVRLLSNSTRTDVLLSLVDDEDWRVRCVLASALGSHLSEEVYSVLSTLLKDKSWWVRLNSAMSLVKMGDKGNHILKAQDPDIDIYAYNMARYVLELPS